MGKRRFQLRLRTLLLLTAGVAVFASIWYRGVGPYYRQTAARELLGGAISESVEQRAGLSGKGASLGAWSERLLASVFGNDLIKRTVELRCEHQQLSGEQITCFRDFPFIERLYLGGSVINDDALFQIAKIPSLRRLALQATHITDEGLKFLADSNVQLEALDIHTTPVADAGLKHLEKMKSLKYLVLGGPIDGPGLASVAKLPSLEHLDLTRTSMPASALRHLKGSSVKSLLFDSNVSGELAAEVLPALPDLELFSGNVYRATDAHVKQIARAGKLQRLYVHGAELTDACVKDLATMNGLRDLNITGPLTDASIPDFESMKRLKSLAIRSRMVLGFPEDRFPRLIQTKLIVRYGKTDSLMHAMLGPSRNSLVIAWPANLNDYFLQSKPDVNKKIRVLTIQDEPGLVTPAVSELAGIERFESLERLAIQRTVAPSELRALDACKNLIALTLMSHTISGQHLAEIRLPAGFKMLGFYGVNRVDPAATADFKRRYPKVNIVSYNSWRTGDHSLVKAHQASGAANVPLQDLQDVDLAPFAANENLRSILLRTRRSRSSDWMLSKSLPQLEHFQVSAGGLTDRHMCYLQQMPNLKSLSIYAAISDNGLQHLKHVPKLQELSLHNATFRNAKQAMIRGDGLKHLVGFKRLKKLTLNYQPLEPESVKWLIGLPLESLNLNGCNLDDASLDQIAKIKTLKTLMLNENRITDRGIESLVRLPNLTLLSINDSEISEGSLMRLADCRSLRYLIAYRCARLTARGVATFRTQRKEVILKVDRYLLKAPDSISGPTTIRRPIPGTKFSY